MSIILLVLTCCAVKNAEKINSVSNKFFMVISGILFFNYFNVRSRNKYFLSVDLGHHRHDIGHHESIGIRRVQRFAAKLSQAGVMPPFIDGEEQLLAKFARFLLAHVGQHGVLNLLVQLAHGGTVATVYDGQDEPNPWEDDVVIESLAVEGFSGAKLAGEWELCVFDSMGADVGDIVCWTLEVKAN